jgi:ribosomal silencing factor RsfS
MQLETLQTIVVNALEEVKAQDIKVHGCAGHRQLHRPDGGGQR